MENNLVDNVIDFQDAQQAFEYVKSVISADYPEYNITKESTIDLSASKFGVFEFEIEYRGVLFKIGCERGVLTHEVKVNLNPTKLYNYDSNMVNILAFNRSNILYTLSTIKRFAEETTSI